MESPGRTRACKPGSFRRYRAGIWRAPTNDVLVVTSDPRGSGKLTGMAKRFRLSAGGTGICRARQVEGAFSARSGLGGQGGLRCVMSPVPGSPTARGRSGSNGVAHPDQPGPGSSASARASSCCTRRADIHHSLQVLILHALLRAINNLTVIAPADSGRRVRPNGAIHNTPHPSLRASRQNAAAARGGADSSTTYQPKQL